MLSRKLESTATMTSSAKAALPVVGQEGRHHIGHPALLEMPRQQRKAHQQQEQVREDHPLVLQVQRKPGEAGAELEAGERELVDRDRRKPDSATASVWWWNSPDPDQRQRRTG